MSDVEDPNLPFSFTLLCDASFSLSLFPPLPLSGLLVQFTDTLNSVSVMIICYSTQHMFDQVSGPCNMISFYQAKIAWNHIESSSKTQESRYPCSLPISFINCAGLTSLPYVALEESFLATSFSVYVSGVGLECYLFP